MSAAEAKKLKNKLRKQQMREQQEKQKQIEAERRKKESQRNRNKDDGEEEKIKEEEIVADKLERVRSSARTSTVSILRFTFSARNHSTKPCDSCNRWRTSRAISSTRTISASKCTIDDVGFDRGHAANSTYAIDCRLGKCLLMLRCLKRMKKLDGDNAKLHSCLMKFLKLSRGTQWVDLCIRRFF